MNETFMYSFSFCGYQSGYLDFSQTRFYNYESNLFTNE